MTTAINRRSGWVRISAVALFLTLGNWSFAQSGDPFPMELGHGLMVGAVDDTTAILQSRLTSTERLVDPRWSGVLGIGGIARFEVAAGADFKNSIRTAWLAALPENDYIVKIKVEGLRPETRYHFRLVYGPDKSRFKKSPSASFTTLGGRTGQVSYSFAVATCMNYSFFHYSGHGSQPPYSGPDKELGYPGLASILALEPDFFVGLGDNVYYDVPGADQDMRGRAETQHQLRMKHQEQFSQQRFLDLFARVGTYWMKDDHDYRFNDSDPFNPVRIQIYDGSDTGTYPKENLYPKHSGSGHAPSHELGVRMFREQFPVVDPRASDTVTYSTRRVNRNLQIWIVEGRDYRSPNDFPDGPQKTIWGKEQKEWLKRTLLESDATFKVLLSPTPLVGPDYAFKRDNHVNPGGFQHEGDEFFRWLTAKEFSPDRFMIVCGDRHWQYHAVHPSGFQEFSVGALVDANAILGHFPGDATSSDPEGKVKHLYHYEEPTGGFLLLKIGQTGEGRARMDFAFFDEKGKVLYTHAKEAALE